jgi:uncharacterized membrane protein
MDLVDWLSLAVRWLHIVVGIGWIGASLYFMWLDAQLQAPDPPRPGVQGELWMVHSGGFYLAEKRRLQPGELPPVLHWFKWEAGLTGITGLLLLGVVYYWRAGAMLVDPAVSPLGPGEAVALGLGLFVAAWLVYDVVWISPLGRDHPGAAAALSWLLLLAATIGLCRLMSGRAAYIHVGGLMGLIMVINVWARILPAQRELIAATREGREQDPVPGRRAKQRSTHNSYMTFPVIFTMFSSHYPATWGHPLNWLVLSLLVVVGAGIRHLMIVHEHGRSARWTWAPVAAAVAAVAYLTWLPGEPRPSLAGAASEPVSFRTARRIVDLRCAACHSGQPTDDAFRVAPNGVTFDAPESIRARAAEIKLRTVLTRSMPLGNKTGMTERERELLGRWVDQGARAD